MSDVADVFDDWARRGRGEGMERGHGKTAGRLMDVMPVGEGTRFLDLGCGNGWACRQAAGKGAIPTGIDVSEEMLERARMLGKGTYLNHDFTDLPFEDGSFDFAWTMEALYYAPDPDAVLREAHRLLTPGSEIHILMDYYEENEASHSWPDDVGVPMVLRSVKDWRDALTEAGFEDAQSERLTTDDPKAERWKRIQGTLHLWARRDGDAS